MSHWVGVTAKKEAKVNGLWETLNVLVMTNILIGWVNNVEDTGEEFE